MFNQIDLREAVRRSIQTEKNAMDFYARGAAGMKNADARKVFELLAREEREHAHWFHNVYSGDDIPDIEAKIEECREEARIVEGYRKKYQDV